MSTGGRPQEFDRAAAFELLLPLLKDGLSLNQACAQANCGVRPYNVLEWVKNDEVLSQQYTRAREIGWLAFAESIATVANEPAPTLESGATDSGYVADKRLRIDTMKWQLSKMLPKIYGERIEQVHSGTLEITQPIDQVKLELAALLKNK